MEGMKDFFASLYAALLRGHRFVTRDVWEIGKPGEQIPRGLIIKNIRVTILLLRGVYEETLLLRASALTFATMLFIVPFLVFMFAFIQTFSLGDEVYRWISAKSTERIEWIMEHTPGLRDEADQYRAAAKRPAADHPAGQAGETASPPHEPRALTEVAAELSQPEIAEQRAKSNKELWNAFIATLFPSWQEQIALQGKDKYVDPVGLMVELVQEQTNIQTLGITGLLWILITVWGLMRNVEWTFNKIWGVGQARNIFRVLSDYLMITLLLPFVVAGVLGVTTALEAFESLGTLSLTLRAAQLFVICLTFSLLYYVVPNTHVQIRYALLGGIVAGSLWMLMSWGYVSFQVGLVRNTFFFAQLALLPVFLFWIYCSWLILLFGALLAYAYQHEETFAMERLADHATYSYREAVAVRAVTEMTRRFTNGLPSLSLAEMGAAWNVPLRLLNQIINALVQAKIVTPCATDPVTYQPSRAPESVRVLDVVHAVRNMGEDPSLLREDETYGPIYSRLQDADRDLLHTSMAELAREIDQAETPVANVVSDVAFTRQRA